MNDRFEASTEDWVRIARVITVEAADLTSPDPATRRRAIATLSQVVHTARRMDPGADGFAPRLWVRAEHAARYALPRTAKRRHTQSASIKGAVDTEPPGPPPGLTRDMIALSQDTELAVTAAVSAVWSVDRAAISPRAAIHVTAAIAAFEDVFPDVTGVVLDTTETAAQLLTIARERLGECLPEVPFAALAPIGESLTRALRELDRA